MGLLDVWLTGMSHDVGKRDGAPLKAVIRLIRRAKSRILVVAGELNHDVYKNERLIKALRQGTRRGATIEIIVGPGWEGESREALTSLDFPVSLYQLAERPIEHFMVVDGKHLRREIPHRPDATERDQYIFYDDVRALGFERRFRELKQQAKSVELAVA